MTQTLSAVSVQRDAAMFRLRGPLGSGPPRHVGTWRRQSDWPTAKKPPNPRGRRPRFKPDWPTLLLDLVDPIAGLGLRGLDLDAAMAVGLAVIPYCIARAIAEIVVPRN